MKKDVFFNIAFITLTVIGVGLPVGYLMSLLEENWRKNIGRCSAENVTQIEIWTDEESRRRFVIVKNKCSGIGICLIPDREEENDCPAPALAEKVILESTVGWKEIQ